MSIGFRAVTKIFETFNDIFGQFFDDIPSKSTIENWVQKSGLSIYEESGKHIKDGDYCLIIDESMIIGSEKLLLALMAPCQSSGRPLEFKDIEVADIFVSKSIFKADVKEQIERVTQKKGRPPLYVVSDNALAMGSGVSSADCTHMCDIAHSFGLLMAKIYEKDKTFIAYNKSMSQVVMQDNMKATAYLLPPKQRTIARFLNLSLWVEWSKKMTRVYGNLTKTEQERFSFVMENDSFIDEISRSNSVIDSILKDVLKRGMSLSSYEKSLELVRQELNTGTQKMRDLGVLIEEFLQRELLKLPKEGNKGFHVSSDIIESVFGFYKYRKSPNRLNGITPYVLFIPLKCEVERNRNIDVKYLLEKNRMVDVITWREKNLTPNLVQKRMKVLGKAS